MGIIYINLFLIEQDQNMFWQVSSGSILHLKVMLHNITPSGEDERPAGFFQTYLY